MIVLPVMQQEAVDAYNASGLSEAIAARVLGIDRKSLISRLWCAIKNGYKLEPNTLCEQAPAGFELTKTTIQTNAEGEVVQRWDRASPIAYAREEIIAYLNERIIPAPLALEPAMANEDLMLEWIIPDHHQGMKAWAAEAGETYNNAIASALMVEAAKLVFQASGIVKHIVVSGVGDSFHSDNRSNQTERSHHVLDVDARYMETKLIALETWCTVIDMAVQNAETVSVIILPGNHDFHTAHDLSINLSIYYRNDPRVTVDTSPKKHKFYQWGASIFMYSHGDTGGKRLAPYLMNHVIKHNLAGVRNMYVRTGHLHKRGKACPPGLTQDDGVFIEIFPTMAPNDAWAEEEAYVNIRSTVANVWHKKYGKRFEISLGVSELMESINKN